jgi:hypothetical protein
MQAAVNPRQSRIPKLGRNYRFSNIARRKYAFTQLEEETAMKNPVVSVRIPAEIERAVEAECAARSITISELVREALLAKFALNRSGRLEQLLYEAVRTRLTLQHFIDQTQSTDLTDGIRAAATRDAQMYVAKLRGE